MNVHPAFTEALKLGHIAPVLLPDGSHLTIDGYEFYEATEGLTNMYQGRFLQFQDVMERHDRLKLDEATLRGFFVSVGELARLALLKIESDPDTAVQSISDIVQLATHGQQRLDLYDEIDPALNVGANTARLYELCSVWYMTPDCDPAVYDSTTGKRTVKLLLSRPELYDFFLRLRMSRFVPLSSLSEENTRSALRGLQNMDFQTFLIFMQTRLFLETNGRKNGSTASLSSVMETLHAYDSCYEVLWKNLTTLWPLGSESDNVLSTS